MSFPFGRNPNSPVRVENGVGYIPVLGLGDKRHELVVRPDASAKALLTDYAYADGPDELFKGILGKWFTANQNSVDGNGWSFTVSASDLQSFVS